MKTYIYIPHTIHASAFEIEAYTHAEATQRFTDLGLQDGQVYIKTNE